MAQDASEGVREDTAELAYWALSDVASLQSSHSPARHHTSSATNQKSSQTDSYFAGRTEHDDQSRHESTGSSRPGVIEEVSEPTTPDSASSSRMPRGISALTEIVKIPPNQTREDGMVGQSGMQPVTVREGIISQPDEQTALLLRKVAYGSDKINQYGSTPDLESQGEGVKGRIRHIRRRLGRSIDHRAHLIRRVTDPKSWDRKACVERGLRRPASYVPPVILGLLLNVLDALSYGKRILQGRFFPAMLIACRDDSISSGSTNFC